MKFWQAGLLGAGVLAVGTAVASAGFFRLAICRKPTSTEDKKQVDVGLDWQGYMPTIKESAAWFSGLSGTHESVNITAFDGLKLHGVLLPAKDPSSKKVMIAFHGYTSNYSSCVCIAQYFHEQGYHVLAVDNRSHGESEGKYVGFGCLDRFDCKKWIEWTVKRFGEDCRIFLHGTSLGGATVMMASGLSLPKNVAGIISDCGFTSAWDVFKHILKRNYHLPAFPLMYTTSAMCKKLSGYDFRDCSALDEVAKTKIPMLFIHGSKDDFVPTWMSHKAYERCGSDIKKLLIVENAGHGAAYYEDTESYLKTMSEFIEQCL